MRKTIDFLINIGKLKEMPRVGWILMGQENPETVAEHTFRLAIFSWLLAKKKGLNTKKSIKVSLFHDLCEVYSGDVTTLLYHPELKREKDKEKRKKIEMKWSRLSLKEKKKIAKIKFAKEQKSLKKLINALDEKTKKEIFSLWVDYEKETSVESRLAHQLNSVETLIQSIEYFGIKEEDAGATWWESTEEVARDPLVLDFLKVIQKKFYIKNSKYTEHEKELCDILDFIIEVGKLKKMPRKGWALRKVKNPETMAGHIFTLVLMALILSRKEKGLNEEKILKMSLSYALPRAYLGDVTLYDKVLLGKTEKEQEEILKKWIRLTKKEKEQTFLKNYIKKKKIIEKMTAKLDKVVRQEIIQCWEEFQNGSSPEGRFLKQVDILATLLQALLYHQKNKNFPIAVFWEWAFESSSSKINFEFMDELKKMFFTKRSFPSFLFLKRTKKT